MEFYREYNDLIMHCLDDGMRKFGIVPLGEKGMLVQYLLEHRYGIRDIVPMGRSAGLPVKWLLWAGSAALRQVPVWCPTIL